MKNTMIINMFLKMLSKRPLTVFIATHTMCALCHLSAHILSLSGLCMSSQPPPDFLLFTQITECFLCIRTSLGKDSGRLPVKGRGLFEGGGHSEPLVEVQT